MTRQPEIVIRDGTIVTSQGFLTADIAVADGKIVAIGDLSHFLNATKYVDARDRFIIPGAIDTHVHFRDPGFPQREDFESGTRAAAAGGVTTIVDMPNSVPTVVEPRILKEKADHCQKKAIVDFGLYAGAGTDSLSEIQELAEEGAMAFKTLMVNFPTTGRESEFQGLHLRTDDAIIDVMDAVSKTRVTHVFHCETDYMIRHEVERLKKERRFDPLAHVDSRPSYAEADAVSRTIILGNYCKDRVHIAHMSSSEGVELIRDAKSHRRAVTCETCPHYLLLTKHDMGRLKNRAKIQPPLRDFSDQESLWQGINDGTVDSICSDHSPFTVEEKSRDIWAALPGAPDIENMIPLMLDCVNKGRLTLSKLVEVSSERPAKIFGIYPRKGTLTIGSDADITIVDMKLEKSISADKMQTRGNESTIFDGMQVKGWPVLTMVRGQVVVEDKNIIGIPGHGKWITPLYHLGN